MSLWLLILGMGLITFGIRLLPILMIQRWEMPPLVWRSLRFVPPAVLSAIFVPELLMPNGNLDLSLGNVRLLAGVLAIGVAWYTKNVILTLIVGMGALWLLIAVK